MMNRIFLGVLLVVVPVIASAQQTCSVWQGTYKLGEERHRAVLQMTADETGHRTVKAFYIDFFPDGINPDSSTISQSHLVMSANWGKGKYEADLSPDGSSLQGTWTWQNQPVSLVLHCTPSEAAWHLPLQYQYHFKDITYARPAPEEPKIPLAPRLAIDYVEQGALAWTGERQCVACHSNGTYMVVRPLMTQELGPPQQAMRDFWVAELKKALAADPATRKGDFDGTQAVYLAAGLAIWDAHVLHTLSPETAQALKLMFEFQRPAGDWFIEDDNNPPFESSPYQVATVAARAVANAPGWLKQQRGTPLAAHIELLKRYLRMPEKMQGDYDRTDLLWTASEYPGLLNERQERELVDMIFAHQQFDGGWSIRTFATPEQWGKGNRAAKLRAELEFSFPQSDGHMTGLAIIALRKAGVPASDPRIQRGIQWLLANQRSSGRWWTRSLNRDGWQFISYSGTAYPLLALSLCNALPKHF
jgi:squalene-hopene/tetraprenyl-beta-curcumene cyclase